MAPKRGGSSSGSGGGSTVSCDACSMELDIVGADWQDGWSIPYLVITCISLAVSLYAAILFFKSPVIRGGIRDKWMTRGLRTAIVCAIFSYILIITDTILFEESATVTYSYFILYIFLDFLWRVAEYLLLLPVALLVLDYAWSESTAFKPLRLINWTTLLIILAVTTTGCVFNVLYNASFLSLGNSATEWFLVQRNLVNLIYAAFYAAVAFELSAFAVMKLGRWSTKSKEGMLWVVLTTLISIQSLFGIIAAIALQIHPTFPGKATQPDFYTRYLLSSVCFVLLGFILKTERTEKGL